MPHIMGTQRPSIHPFVLVVIASPLSSSNDVHIVSTPQLHVTVDKVTIELIVVVIQQFVDELLMLLLLMDLMLTQWSATEATRIAAVLSQWIANGCVRRISRCVVVQQLVLFVVMHRNALWCRVIR